MSSASRRRLLGGGLAALLLLALFFRGVEWSALGAAFRSADPLYLAGVVAATLLTYSIRAWRWGFLLAPLARVPYRRLFSATWVGFMTGLLVPRAGEVVRPYLIARRHGVSTIAGFASIVLERLVDVVAVVILFGLYLYVLPMPPAQARGAVLDGLKLGGGLAGAGALALTLALVGFHLHAERAAAFVESLLRVLPAGLASRLGRAVRSFGTGLAVLQAPLLHLLAILGQSLLLWLVISLGVHWNNRAFGLELPLHSAFLILVFLTVGVAIPTPGMVGGFHEFYLLALTEAFGVEKTLAAAAGIACHALTNLPVLLLGLLYLGEEGLTLAGVARLGEQGAPAGDERGHGMAAAAAQPPAGRTT